MPPARFGRLGIGHTVSPNWRISARTFHLVLQFDLVVRFGVESDGLDRPPRGAKHRPRQLCSLRPSERGRCRRAAGSLDSERLPSRARAGEPSAWDLAWLGHCLARRSTLESIYATRNEFGLLGWGNSKSSGKRYVAKSCARVAATFRLEWKRSGSDRGP
jgi:hypothetical protein